MEFICRIFPKEFDKKKGDVFYRQCLNNVFVKDKGKKVDIKVRHNGKTKTVTFFVSQDVKYYNATESEAGLVMKDTDFKTVKGVVNALNNLDSSKLKNLCDFYQSEDIRLKRMKRFLENNKEDTITYIEEERKALSRTPE